MLFLHFLSSYRTTPHEESLHIFLFFLSLAESEAGHDCKSDRNWLSKWKNPVFFFSFVFIRFTCHRHSILYHLCHPTVHNFCFRCVVWLDRKNRTKTDNVSITYWDYLNNSWFMIHESELFVWWNIESKIIFIIDK